MAGIEITADIRAQPRGGYCCRCSDQPVVIYRISRSTSLPNPCPAPRRDFVARLAWVKGCLCFAKHNTVRWQASSFGSRLANGRLMGQMLFVIPRPERVIPGAAEQAYLASADGVPWECRCTLSGE